MNYLHLDRIFLFLNSAVKVNCKAATFLKARKVVTVVQFGDLMKQLILSICQHTMIM